MASQVPYTGVPDAAPQIDPLSQVHVDTPIAAFGGTVAGAIQHLGETEAGAGKELFARAEAFQTLDEQAKADAAASAASDRMVQRTLEYDQLQGQDRVDGNKQYMDDINKIREEGANDLDSPYAKQQYLRDSRRAQSQMVFYGGRLARQAQEDAIRTAKDDGLASISNRIAITGGDITPADLDQMRQKAGHFVEVSKGLHPGDPNYDTEVSRELSPHIAKVISAVRLSDPVRAREMTDAYGKSGLLRPEDVDRLSEVNQNAVETKLGRKLGNEAASGAGTAGKDPKAVARAARDAAEKADPGNKNLADNAEDAALARYDHEKQLLEASEREQTRTLLRGIDGTDTNGKVPISLEEARQDPNWAKAYDESTKDVQGKIREKIRENQTTDGWIPNDEGNKQYNKLWTALTDPRSSAKEVDDALSMNVLSTSMTRQQRAEIQKLQDNIITKQSTQENINSAMEIPQVRQALTAAGINKGTPEYDAFAVQFGTAVKNYAEGGHRTVKDNEQLGAIAQQMLYHQASSWLNPYTWGQKSLYQNILEAKPELKNQAVNVYKRLYGKAPTDQQLEQMAPLFYQKYFQELGQKSRPPVGKATNSAPSSTRPVPQG